MGIYVYKMAKDIGAKIGFELKQFHMKGRKITVKRVSPSNVDIDVSARLTYTVDNRKVQMNLDTAITPGNVPRAEVRVVLDNGDQIVQNSFVHPHFTTGTFIEHANGKITRIQTCDPCSSYTYQMKVVNSHLAKSKKTRHPCKDMSMDEQVYLIEFMELLAAKATKTNNH